VYVLYTDTTAYTSDNFVVGLTNVSPLTSTPTLWNYTLCGQYPGAVPAAATVSLYCPYNLPPFRYVIVQFDMTDAMNLCELQVIAPGIIYPLLSFCCFIRLLVFVSSCVVSNIWECH